MSTIWENTDGSAEQYIFASEINLMSVMSHFYYIIIDWGISASGHDKEVVDRLNDFDKRYIYKFISTVQLPGLNIFDSQIQIHTGTQTNGVSLAKESQ